MPAVTPSALPAEQWIALAATMTQEVRDELDALVSKFPPTSFDNMTVLSTSIATMVLQFKIHPTVADSALRWFEASINSLLVAKDKVPKPAGKIEVNLLGRLAEAQHKARQIETSPHNDVYDAEKSPLERVMVDSASR